MQAPNQDVDNSSDTIDILDLAVVLALHWKLICIGSLLAGLTALGLSFLIKPTFTATAVMLPPQQQQSAAAAAIQSLGALAGVAGAVAGVKNPADQYVALLESARISDRIIDKYQLMSVYAVEVRDDARKALDAHVSIGAGKKDGLITINVDDVDPQRAADIANQYIEELKTLTTELAVTEAQQRRVFFETQLKSTREALAKSQEALQDSGISEGVLRADPDAAATGYARIKAEVTAAEVRLEALRSFLTPQSSEYRIAQENLNALKAQLAKIERPSKQPPSSDYISKYREFKYQETLFELLSKQLEMARIDESREGLIVQTLDRASAPERKSKPKKAQIAIISTVVSALLLTIAVLLRYTANLAAQTPSISRKLHLLRDALGRRATT